MGLCWTPPCIDFSIGNCPLSAAHAITLTLETPSPAYPLAVGARDASPTLHHATQQRDWLRMKDQVVRVSTGSRSLRCHTGKE